MIKAIILRILNKILTSVGAVGIAKTDDLEQVASSIIFIGSIAWSIWDETRKAKAEKPDAPKIQVPLILLIGSLILLPGCANNWGYAFEKQYDKETGKIVSYKRVRQSNVAVWETKSEIGKAKALQTDKSQSVGVQDVKQEVTEQAVQKMVEGALPTILEKFINPK